MFHDWRIKDLYRFILKKIFLKKTDHASDFIWFHSPGHLEKLSHEAIHRYHAVHGLQGSCKGGNDFRDRCWFTKLLGTWGVFICFDQYTGWVLVLNAFLAGAQFLLYSIALSQNGYYTVLTGKEPQFAFQAITHSALMLTSESAFPRVLAM